MQYDTTSTLLHRHLLIIFVLALGIRAFNAFWILGANIDLLEADAGVYWRAATALLQTGQFLDGSIPFGGQPLTERMPGYVIFLAVVRFVFGESFLAVLLTQAAIDAGTVVLIGWLAARLGQRVGLLAAGLAALSPNLVTNSSSILTETLFLFLMTGALVAATQAARTRAIAWIAVTGLLIGSATMVRPVSYPLILAVAIGGGWAFYLVERSLLRAATAAIVLLTIGLLSVLPWQLRNMTLFDTASLTSQSGTHMQGWVTASVVATAEGISRGEASLRLGKETQERLRARGQDVSAMDPFAASKAIQSEAFEQLMAQPPSAIARSYLTGAVLFMAAPAVLFDPRVRLLPKPSFDETSGSIWSRAGEMFSGASGTYAVLAVSGLVLTGLCGLASLIGFLVLARRHPWVAAAALLWILYFVLVTGPVVGAKYRLPAEPVLLVLAAIGLDWLWSRISGGQTRGGLARNQR